MITLLLKESLMCKKEVPSCFFKDTGSYEDNTYRTYNLGSLNFIILEVGPFW